MKEEFFEGKVLEKIELPKRKLTKEEVDLLYNKGKKIIIREGHTR